MGLLRKVTGKTVSRKDATAQRKTFLYFDLILNRKDAKGAKVFLIMGDVRAGPAKLYFEPRLNALRPGEIRATEISLGRLSSGIELGKPQRREGR